MSLGWDVVTAGTLVGVFQASSLLAIVAAGYVSERLSMAT